MGGIFTGILRNIDLLGDKQSLLVNYPPRTTSENISDTFIIEVSSIYVLFYQLVIDVLCGS